MSTYSSRHLAYNSIKDFGGVRRNLITLNKHKRYNFYNATGMIQMKRDNNMWPTLNKFLHAYYLPTANV